MLIWVTCSTMDLNLRVFATVLIQLLSNSQRKNRLRLHLPILWRLGIVPFDFAREDLPQAWETPRVSRIQILTMKAGMLLLLRRISLSGFLSLLVIPQTAAQQAEPRPPAAEKPVQADIEVG